MRTYYQAPKKITEKVTSLTRLTVPKFPTWIMTFTQCYRKAHRLKVRVSFLVKFSYSTIAWVMSDFEGWTFTEFDESDQSRIFTTIKYGEVRLRFGLHDDIKIEIYEQDTTTPTRVKNIDTY